MEKVIICQVPLYQSDIQLIMQALDQAFDWHDADAEQIVNIQRKLSNYLQKEILDEK